MASSLQQEIKAIRDYFTKQQKDLIAEIVAYREQEGHYVETDEEFQSLSAYIARLDEFKEDSNKATTIQELAQIRKQLYKCVEEFHDPGSYYSNFKITVNHKI